MTTTEYELAYQRGFRDTLQTMRARGLDHFRAEEIAQRAWCKGYERINQLRDPAAVRPWVNSIARNDLSNEAKRNKPLCELLPVHERTATSRDTNAVIDLDRILRFCNSVERTLLERRYLDGYSREEMARSLAISPAAIDKRISRALARIRRAVGQERQKTTQRRQNAANGNSN